jgi:hypothetical protein
VKSLQQSNMSFRSLELAKYSQSMRYSKVAFIVSSSKLDLFRSSSPSLSKKKNIPYLEPMQQAFSLLASR